MCARWRDCRHAHDPIRDVQMTRVPWTTWTMRPIAGVWGKDGDRRDAEVVVRRLHAHLALEDQDTDAAAQRAADIWTRLK